MSLTNGFGQQFGWVQVTSPASSSLKNIYVSGNEAWLNSNLQLFYSNDYPNIQFSLVFENNNHALYDMIIRKTDDHTYGWAVGSSSLGARLTDEFTWTQMSLGGTSTYTCVSFPTTTLGFASGTDKRLHKTVNGGVNWYDAGVVLGFSTVASLEFTDSLTGYVGTPDPRLAKTTDGGVTWVDENADFAGGINDIFFLDTNHGWAIGYYDILRYSNGVWNQIDNPTSYDLNSVFFMNEYEGWIAGNEGTILHSLDGGETWTLQSSGTSETLLDIFFTSPSNGYAVGTNGTILHYTQLSNIKNPEGQNESFYLMQNNPNPFQTKTNIKYTLHQSGFVNLKVYNLYGEMITSLINEYQSAGEHSVAFDGSDLPSGIYFYRISIANKFETGKMIIAK